MTFPSPELIGEPDLTQAFQEVILIRLPPKLQLGAKGL